MTRLRIVTAVLAAALSGSGAIAAEVAPSCGAFDVVSNPDSEGTDLRSVAARAGTVWAVGHRWDAAGARDGAPLALRWDGSAFAAEPVPDLSHLGAHPSLASVGIAPTGDPWVVGGLRDAITGRNVPLILRWSGGFWEAHLVTPVSSFAARYPRLVDVAAVAIDDAWTVGQAETEVKGAVEPFAAHWDGTAWTEVAMPGTADNRIVTAVSATADGVWAVGYDVMAAGPGLEPTTYARVFRFAGSAWSVVDTPAAGKAGSTLLDVVVLSAKDVWAVGSNSSEGLFLHWDGFSWATVAGPDHADPRSVSGRAADDVWAAGSKGYYHWNGKGVTFVPAASDAGSGARRAITAGGPCDVWSVASTSLGTDSKSQVERMSAPVQGQPPAAPTGLVATPKAKAVVLAWLPGSSDPTGPVGQSEFVIERCIGDATACVKPFAIVAKVIGTVTTYVDAGLEGGASYAYRVSAVNPFGVSKATDPVTAVPLPDAPSALPATPASPGAGSSISEPAADTVPGTVVSDPYSPDARLAAPLPPVAPAVPPTPVGFAVKAASAKEVVLSWRSGSDPTGPAVQEWFVIERCAVGSCGSFIVIAKSEGSVTSYSDFDVKPSSSYTYRVYALNKVGASPATIPATATTPDVPSSLPVPGPSTGQAF